MSRESLCSALFGSRVTRWGGYPLPRLGRVVPWRWRLWFVKRQYDYGTALAKRVCRGNRYGVHTDSWPAHRPLGGQCFCSRVRRRLDYIPF